MLNRTYIFGLGNPGNKYQLSRHNIGFLFTDFLRRKLDLPVFSLNKKLEAEISSNENLVLTKPMTFMNHSGRTVRKTLDYFNEELSLSPSSELKSVYVVHDDLDLDVGEFKIQFGVGPKQHNGLLSIYQYLKTQQFWHVRIGIDDRQGDRSVPPDRYVLQKLPSAQLDHFNHVFAQIQHQLKLVEGK